MGKSSEFIRPLAKVHDVAVDGEEVADKGNNLVGVHKFLTNPILLDEVFGSDSDDSRPLTASGGKQHHEASAWVERLQSVLIDAPQGTLANQEFLAWRDGRSKEH